jgi:hypothetical protein
MKRLSLLGALLACTAVALISPALFADTAYRLERAYCIGSHDCNQPVAIFDVNDAGQACGWFTYDCREAAIYSNETDPRCTFASLPCASAQPRALNALGHVVGKCGNEAWYWTGTGSGQLLGDLPGGEFRSEAYDINARDQVVGFGSTASGLEAFIWTPQNGMVPIGMPPGADFSVGFAINDSGWVACHGTLDGRGYAALWTPTGGFQVLLRDAWPTAINADGTIAGSYNGPAGPRIFLWHPQYGVEFLPQFQPGVQTCVNDMNDAETIVGYALSYRTFVPLVWRRESGFRDLALLVSPCTPLGSGWLGNVVAINNFGQIACYVGGWVGILTPYLPGDLDEDGDVQLDDLAALVVNFGRDDAGTYADGDLDCDGFVNLADLATLLANFGETLPTP